MSAAVSLPKIGFIGGGQMSTALIKGNSSPISSVPAHSPQPTAIAARLLILWWCTALD